MGFWDDIYELREQGRLPRIWKPADLRPYLIGPYAEKTIGRNPPNSSITRDGKIIGNFVKRGRRPKAWRMGDGKYQLIVDPGDDAVTQDAERQRVESYGHIARAIAAGDLHPLRAQPLKYDRPFDPVALDDWEALQ